MSWFQKIFNTEKNPIQYQWYEDLFNENTRATPLDQATFVVLDTETTGLNPKTDRILSIGAFKVQGYHIKIDEGFEEFMQQSQYNKESIAIHEILPGQSSQASDKKNLLESFLKYIGNAVLVGHHVDFDFQILKHAFQRNLGVHLKNKTYDTLHLLKRVDTHYQHSNLHQGHELGLDHICERYQIEIHQRHTATGDAFATALLFMKLLKKLEKRGIKNLGEMLKR